MIHQANVTSEFLLPDFQNWNLLWALGLRNLRLGQTAKLPRGIGKPWRRSAMALGSSLCSAVYENPENWIGKPELADFLGQFDSPDEGLALARGRPRPGVGRRGSARPGMGRRGLAMTSGKLLYQRIHLKTLKNQGKLKDCSKNDVVYDLFETSKGGAVMG